MQPTEPVGAEADGPYFFLSYAHVPRGGSDRADPDLWVHRLFRDLCDVVLNLTTVPAGGAGYMDRSMRAGEDLSDELARSLAHCRVFVPLYSPRYFISPWCGREWTVFGRRPGSMPGAVVPALWAPVLEHRLPSCTRDVPHPEHEHTQRYREFGLYGLAKLRSFRSDYEKDVHTLARRIVAAGDAVDVSHGDGGKDSLDAAQDAFTHAASPRPAEPRPRPTTRRRLRISVAAASRTNLPEGRDPAYYGRTPLDWRPYHPASPYPLGKLASDIAERLDFQPDVREFDHRAVPADGPEVLLLDRWLLRDPEHRARLGEFDAADRPATGVVVPWNGADRDDEADGRSVAAEVEAVLPRRTRRQRQAGRPPVLGPDPATFSRQLPRVVHWAATEYLRRAPARVPPGEGPQRFRLGDMGREEEKSRQGNRSWPQGRGWDEGQGRQDSRSHHQPQADQPQADQPPAHQPPTDQPSAHQPRPKPPPTSQPPPTPQHPPNHQAHQRHQGSPLASPDRRRAEEEGPR
ncbi:TIR-like protein FxsC [Streptomyces acidiscabies]|uniref:TIR-like protein FxsC n=2 Tax=Streptomyces acidiscabies TaxID=42234 RepID=A0AAP6BAI6_9ACTN|nr:TIR-like protein FxsC [Streptomyces acidiscabies]MBP5935665.1 TIR domain-containing protein [Streptomyces sp. LBUM 1476]MBZ3916443.1 TIR domain-containing protein [Streptomyces acidiscabies]MDX2961184.1 TIR-like protein FxsC [Streptomyces acidiscabies]MDX3022862.1 TIR-like protein FxsC [Streptomyces acidiscabies]MDX3791891.1 TIR-like protein FxsC [Streptomyces acidiscabies]